MNDLPGVATDLSAAAGLATYLIAGFRRAVPDAPTWAFVVAAAIAGQVASFLILLLRAEPWDLPTIAGHVIIGIVAAAGEPLVKRSNVKAEGQHE